MSAAGRDANGRVHRGPAAFADRLIRVGQRFITENAEGTIVLVIFVAFVGVWMLFWQISTASVDVHFDASEAMIWAQHFAFGYKHPPLTGWLFASWFSVFPRQQWAANFLNVTTSALALAVTWRLLRDYLDKNWALFGLLALMLIPLYDVKAEVLNANNVMTPFWAAALLFYLRARRGLGSVDAFLAGGFASLTMLGKYWAVFLFVGMAAAALVGLGTRRFWRSPAPYVMALGAAVVIAPHVWWLLTQSGASVQFAESVINPVSFGAALAKSANYVLGAVAYIVVPLIFFLRCVRAGRHGPIRFGPSTKTGDRLWILCWCRSLCRRSLISRFPIASPRPGPRQTGRFFRSFSTRRASSSLTSAPWRGPASPSWW